jgi:hypothetical protein
MEKIVYEEQYLLHKEQDIPMRIVWSISREGDWSTDISGEAVYCGWHYKQQFIIETVEGHYLRGFAYNVGYSRGKGKNYQFRFDLAKNWLYKFRRLNETKDYHPMCHNLNDERSYPRLICPKVSFHDPDQPAKCDIKPNPWGYFGSRGIRDLPRNRKCDVGMNTAKLMGNVIDKDSGFTMYDYWRCAQKTELKYIQKEVEHESF